MHSLENTLTASTRASASDGANAESDSAPSPSPVSNDAKNEVEKRAKPQVSFFDLVRNWLRHSLIHRPDSSLKEVLEEVIEEHEGLSEAPLAPEEKTMLRNMLSFSDIKVSDIMVPRTEIAAIASNTSLEELTAHIMEIRHTRIPVYEDTLDHIRGFVHVKDLFPMVAQPASFNMSSLVRPLLFVPPSMRIIDLLVKMRHAGSHMAIVVDEYGGTDGLVTMEDLFEEIVGDIQDEHDEEDASKDRLIKVGEHSYDVNAGILIEKLEQQLDMVLVSDSEREEFDTLGGLISSWLGRVPVRGETVEYKSGISFDITDADPRRIHRVRMRIAPSLS